LINSAGFLSIFSVLTLSFCIQTNRNRQLLPIVFRFGVIESPDAKPGETVQVKVECNAALQNADLFCFTAIDPHGAELYTWSWPVVQPEEEAKDLLSELKTTELAISVMETDPAVTASVAKLTIEFNKTDGTLLSVKNSNGDVSFTGGPVIAGVESKIIETRWEKDTEGNFIFEIITEGYPKK